MKTLSSLVFGILILFSQTCEKSTKKLKSKNLNGNFSIIEVDGNPISSEKITIKFDSSSGKVSGNSGCNNYFGNYKVTGKKLDINQLVSNNKMCIDNNFENLKSTEENTVMKIENMILEQLTKVSNYKFIDDTLILKNSDSEVIFKAEPYKSNEVEDFTLYYETLSMIGEKQIKYHNGILECSKNGRTINSMSLPIKDRNDIHNAFKELNLDSLAKEETPFNDRHIDAAAYASFKVLYKGKTYKTPSFDHGKPPLSLERIIMMINQQKICE